MKTAAIIGIGVLALLLLKGQPAEASSDEIEDYNPGDFVPNDPGGTLIDYPANPGDGWIEATPEPQTVSTKFAIGDKIQIIGGNDVWLVTAIDPNRIMHTGDIGGYAIKLTSQTGITGWESFKNADHFYIKVG